jgi:hypothetical protein
MIKTALHSPPGPSLLCIAICQNSGYVLFLLVAKWEPPWCLPMELRVQLLRGPTFPFFIKKRKQEIECKTLQRLVSHQCCKFNHTPDRKWKYSSHSDVRSPFMAHSVFFRFELDSVDERAELWAGDCHWVLVDWGIDQHTDWILNTWRRAFHLLYVSMVLLDVMKWGRRVHKKILTHW